MEILTKDYLMRAENWLFLSLIIYFLMNGAQIFETLVYVPKWTASPPETFQLLADKNGANLKTFWIVFHSLHEITFIMAIIFSWKIDPIRGWLIALFILHLAVRAWTILYFAPNIIEFQKSYELSEATNNLVDKARLWQKLNFIRVGIYLVISISLVPLLMKIKGLIVNS